MLARKVDKSLAKRLTDIGIASILIVLTSPLVLLAMAAVLLTMGRPILFTQERTGLSERKFRLLKLRTMGSSHDAHGIPLTDAERLTAVGRILRKTSLDELPQMINVIRGEMSLVGPRPLLPRYDPWYTDTERLRFAARPGITGLAQVSGRNNLGWDARLNMDVRYVRDWSFRMDLAILISTGWRAFLGSGVSVDTNAVLADLDMERQGR
ncbi:sugar transferase [Krasilnikovia sp. MM14-A1259]|uniref:sugar transferase n=1 Tax=Krasilnikovia sp. MM14-A1259 TaxID=3373539 RepID=UPI0037F4632F